MDRLDEIDELAEAVACEHFPTSEIDPADLIARKSISLSFGQYGDAFDGMLEHRSGRFHVYCNQRIRHPARIRFTLGHELGHFFIDEHRRALESGVSPHKSLCEYQSDNPVEREADHFASSLLMPRGRFESTARKKSPGMDAITALASHFKTSLTSTALRFVKLDISPCVMIKWNPDGTSWRWFSDSTFAAGYRKIREDRAAIPADAPTSRILRGNSPGPGQFLHGVTVASQWFPFFQQGSTRDVMIAEQAISLGEYGALTLILPFKGTFA